MEKPTVDECCGSGCSPCVFDVYESFLQKKNNKFAISKPNYQYRYRHDLLTPLKYNPFVFVKETKLNDVTRIYAFQPATANLSESIDGILPYKPGQHLIMIDAKNDFKIDRKLKISRSYTPISIAEKEINCVVKLMIKLYSNGLMSSFISKLVIHDIIFLRGPFGDFQHVRDSNYVMICAGTGLAPLYPIIKNILDDENDETTMKLLYACSTLDQILMRDDLREFARFWNFSAFIYLSQKFDSELTKHVRWDENIQIERISAKLILDKLNDQKLSRALVCGFESFNKDVQEFLKQCGIENEKIFVF